MRSDFKKKLLAGASWAFFAKASSGFLTVGITALITRLLPPEEVGVFFLSFSMVLLLSIVARFGLDHLMIKVVGEKLASKHYASAKDIVLKSLFIIFMVSMTLSIIMLLVFDGYIANKFIDSSLIPGLRLFIFIWIPLTAIHSIYSEVFRAYHNIKYASIFSSGTAFGGFSSGWVIGGVLLLAYIYNVDVELEYLYQLILGVTFLFIIVETFLLMNIISYSEFENIQDEIKLNIWPLIKQAFPFFISILSFILIIHADTIILGFYRGEDEVALYSTSTRIAKLVFTSIIIVNEVIAPIIVKLNAENNFERLEKILRLSATFAAIVSTVLISFLVLFSEYLLGSLYGEYYVAGAPLLIILGLGQLISVWAGSSSFALSMMGYQVIGMYISITTSLIALIACILLAEPYGAQAIAVIISSAWIFQNVISLLFLRKLSGFWAHAGVLYSLKEVKAYLRKS